MMLSTIAIFIGILVGLSITYIFKIIPESWLQDYDYDPKAPDYRPSKRMRIGKEGVVSAIICAAFYGAAAYFSFKTMADQGQVLHLIIIALLVPDVIIVMMSDRLNRIIPDQCSIFILLLALVSICGDFIEGTYWFSETAPWYYPLLSRVIAMLIGGGFLWLLNFISQTFLGKEGMGQGDMKLLGASGLLCGVYGLIILIYAAVFSALFFAIPLFIKKRMRIAREQKMIRESDDPVATRRELKIAKSKIHFADDPDYLAFGPFLAFGAAVFIALEPLFASKMMDTLVLLGVYF